MHPIRKKAQPVAILMIVLTMVLSVPYQAAVAALDYITSWAAPFCYRVFHERYTQRVRTALCW